MSGRRKGLLDHECEKRRNWKYWRSVRPDAVNLEVAGSTAVNTEPDTLLASLASRFPIPEGIRKSKEAFFRDLADLIGDPSLRGKWVAYHGDERIGIANDDEPLILECRRRGLAVDEYIVETIEPKTAAHEQVDFPLAWQ